ncbi:hypothetical protein EJ03DRAFT_387503 [Teratosphaeria nubilosa]|uniref:Nuclear localization protein n=1 Tax=Teratosphaeria nubilosa TaxID=161662 RepID=A0A6G1LJN8_9PEZI|nr:hypothetical protein EJ03DRAFT_387503 [Teratosphaeria nubilosa]
MQDEEILYQDDGEDEEDAGTPAQEDEEDGADGEDDDGEPEITSMPRRKAGRPRGSGRDDAEEGSEAGTPFKRRRGRPEGSGRGRGRGSGLRGRRRGQRPEPPSVVVDKDGNELPVANDEVQIDQDDEGDTKVDEKGNLQGGRLYRVRTFKVIDKEDRLYMLSTEPARCCGFRDSYLFFTKHPKLYKVLLTEDQKKDLIDRDILPSSYKGRNIAVVTARSVFREFGARIIVGGRRIIDDYQVANAKAEGAVEGELADPNDRIPDEKAEYDRNRYVAWFGASEVYRNVGQGATAGQAKPGLVGKRRTNITVQNWQYMHAREASRFNTAIAAMRHSTQNGVYDSHTNLMFYPTIMQPTHARWEQIPPPSPPSNTKALTNGLTNGHHANGDASEESPGHEEPMDIDREAPPSIFSAVPAPISRNFAVIDTVYTAPPLSNAGYPGPDGSITDPTSGPNGLSSIASEILDELPEDCRRALEEAKKTEEDWKKQWGTEAQSGGRRDLKIGFAGYPV